MTRGRCQGRDGCDMRRQWLFCRCHRQRYLAEYKSMQTSGMSVQRCADLKLHMQRRSKLCVMEHSVKTSSTNVNILSSGSIPTHAMWWLVHETWTVIIIIIIIRLAHIKNDFQQGSMLQTKFRTMVNFNNCVKCFIYSRCIARILLSIEQLSTT